MEVREGGDLHLEEVIDGRLPNAHLRQGVLAHSAARSAAVADGGAYHIDVVAALAQVPSAHEPVE